MVFSFRFMAFYMLLVVDSCVYIIYIYTNININIYIYIFLFNLHTHTHDIQNSFLFAYCKKAAPIKKYKPFP